MEKNRHSSFEKLGDATSQKEEITKGFIEHIRKLFFHELDQKDDLSDLIVDYVTLDLKKIIEKEDFPIKSDSDADILIQNALETHSADLFNGNVNGFMEELNRIFVYYTIFLLAENKEKDFQLSFAATTSMIQELINRINHLWDIQINVVNIKLEEHYKQIMGNLTAYKKNLIAKIHSFYEVDLNKNIYEEYNKYNRLRNQSIPFLQHEVLTFIHKIGKQELALTNENYQNLNDKAFNVIHSILKMTENNDKTNKNWFKVLEFMVVFLISERETFVKNQQSIYSKWNLYLIKRLILILKGANRTQLGVLIKDLYEGSIEKRVDPVYDDFVTQNYLKNKGIKVYHGNSIADKENNLKVVDVVLHTDFASITSDEDLNEIADNLDVLYIDMMENIKTYKVSMNVLKNQFIPYSESDFYKELRNAVFRFRTLNPEIKEEDFGVELDAFLDKLYKESNSLTYELVYTPLKIQNILSLMLDGSYPFTFVNSSPRTHESAKKLFGKPDFQLFDHILQNLYLLKEGNISEPTLVNKEYIDWIDSKPFNTDDIKKLYLRKNLTGLITETKKVSLKSGLGPEVNINHPKLLNTKNEHDHQTPTKISIDNEPTDFNKDNVELKGDIFDNELNLSLNKGGFSDKIELNLSNDPLHDNKKNEKDQSKDLEASPKSKNVFQNQDEGDSKKSKGPVKKNDSKDSDKSEDFDEFLNNKDENEDNYVPDNIEDLKKILEPEKKPETISTSQTPSKTGKNEVGSPHKEDQESDPFKNSNDDTNSNGKKRSQKPFDPENKDSNETPDDEESREEFINQNYKKFQRKPAKKPENSIKVGPNEKGTSPNFNGVKENPSHDSELLGKKKRFKRTGDNFSINIKPVQNDKIINKDEQPNNGEEIENLNQKLLKGDLSSGVNLIKNELGDSTNVGIIKAATENSPKKELKKLENNEIEDDESVDPSKKTKKNIKKFIDIDQTNEENKDNKEEVKSPVKDQINTPVKDQVRSPTKEHNNSPIKEKSLPITEGENKINLFPNEYDNIVELLAGALPEEDLDYLRKRDNLEGFLKSGGSFFDKDGYLTEISYVKIVPVNSDCYKALMNK